MGGNTKHRLISRSSGKSLPVLQCKAALGPPGRFQVHLGGSASEGLEGSGKARAPSLLRSRRLWDVLDRQQPLGLFVLFLKQEEL